jgi:hypothetical protein
MALVSIADYAGCWQVAAFQPNRTVLTEITQLTERDDEALASKLCTLYWRRGQSSPSRTNNRADEGLRK